MIWIGLAILIIAGWVLYSRHRGSVRLTKDQADLVLGLISKERREIEKRRQEIIDRGATEGKTLPLEKIFSNIRCESDVEKGELEKTKRELIEKYGPNIPLDVAYRLIKEFDPDEDSPWSDKPRCFERHLQRREGNPLFPPERRVVTQREIEEARERDRIEQLQFREKVQMFASSIATSDAKVQMDKASSTLQEIENLLEEAASIGGDIEDLVEVLERTEQTLTRSMNEASPDGADLLNRAHAQSTLARESYLAQATRKGSPILKEEQIPALLSEDMETIAKHGYLSRAYSAHGSDYRPNETDIRTHLEKAVKQGFSRDRADRIIAAWNQIEWQPSKAAAD